MCSALLARMALTKTGAETSRVATPAPSVAEASAEAA
jgi:hypothetical protein